MRDTCVWGGHLGGGRRCVARVSRPGRSGRRARRASCARRRGARSWRRTDWGTIAWRAKARSEQAPEAAMHDALARPNSAASCSGACHMQDTA